MKGGSAYKMQIRLSFLHQLHVHTNVFCLLLHILLCDMGVDVHCSREIGMPHDLLNEFNIVGAFAEPGTEGVPQVVNTKMREQIRFTVFQFSLIHFLHVVSYADSLNRPIDIVGAHE